MSAAKMELKKPTQTSAAIQRLLRADNTP